MVVLLLFKQIVESAKVKMRKPELRIYQYTLEKLEVLPQEIVFLDDRGENLKAAKQLGFRTIKVNLYFYCNYALSWFKVAFLL